MTQDIPTDADFERAWKDLRLRRGLFYWGLFGCLPTLLLFYVLAYLAFGDQIARHILFTLMAFWAFFFLFNYFRILFFRCPRCHRLFYFFTPWPLFWPFLHKCIHCRLRRNSLPDVSERLIVIPQFSPKRALKITAVYIAAIVFIFSTLIYIVLGYRIGMDEFLEPMFVDAVNADWTPETLQNYGTEEFRHSTLTNEFHIEAGKWRSYGQIVRYIGVKEFDGSPDMAHAEVWLQFDAGVRSFHAVLVDFDGKWRLQTIQTGYE